MTKSTRFVRGGVVATSLLALVPLAAWMPPPATQVLTIDGAADRLEEIRASSLLLPIHNWNCMCIDVAALPVGILLPNDLSGDADRARELLTMVKGVYEEGLLPAGGQIGTWLANGDIAAIEVRWSDGANTIDPPALDDHLGTIGKVQNPEGEILADIYCYDATLLANREAELVLETGGPLLMYRIWLGPVFLSCGLGAHALKFSGTENTVIGDATTNGDLRVTGDDHVAEDRLRYGGSATVTGSGHSLPDMAQGASNLPLAPLPSSAAAYLALATANSTAFVGDVTIQAGGSTGLQTDTGTPLSGVVYATGRIYVEGNAVVGTITLVSELGISISGDENELTAAVDDVLAIVLGGAVPVNRLDNNILVDGRLGAYEGSIWAPGGDVEIVATSSELTGCVVAENIRFAGYGNVFSDGSY